VESSNKYGMSEELRDEHFNQKLMEAFDLKNRGGKDQEALELYLNVLSQDFLKVCALTLLQNLPLNFAYRTL
jgi:hypothetical protein